MIKSIITGVKEAYFFPLLRNRNSLDWCDLNFHFFCEDVCPSFCGIKFTSMIDSFEPDIKSIMTIKQMLTNCSAEILSDLAGGQLDASYIFLSWKESDLLYLSWGTQSLLPLTWNCETNCSPEFSASIILPHNQSWFPLHTIIRSTGSMWWPKLDPGIPKMSVGKHWAGFSSIFSFHQMSNVFFTFNCRSFCVHIMRYLEQTLGPVLWKTKIIVEIIKETAEHSYILDFFAIFIPFYSI